MNLGMDIRSPFQGSPVPGVTSITYVSEIG